MIVTDKTVELLISNMPAIIAALGAMLASIASLVVALRTHTKVEHVERATNGMKKELENIARSEGYAQGTTDEQTREASHPG
jgi:hypothetical protein